MRPVQSLLLVFVLLAVIGGAWYALRDVDEAGAVAPASAGPASAQVDEPADLLRPEDGEPEPVDERVALETPEAQPEPSAAAAGPSLGALVQDVSGRPIAGALVIAAPNDGFGITGLPLDIKDAERMPWMRRHKTRTDKDGRFDLRGPGAGEVRLAVRAPGFSPWDRNDVVLPAGGAHELDPIVLEASPVLTGRVVDVDGRAVAGAEIQRMAADGMGFVFGGGIGQSGVAVAETGPDGSFIVDQLPTGSYRLRVAHEDHPDQFETGRTRTPGERIPGLTIVVERGFQIQGVVVGAPAGASERLSVRAMPFVEGRTVHLMSTDGSFPAEPRLADVASDGSFLVRGLREGGKYNLRVRKKPRETGSMTSFASFFGSSLSPQVAALAGERGVELPYQPEAALVFQVIDAETALPITDFEASAGSGFMLPMTGDDGRMVREHPEGRARFGNLRPGPEDDRVRLKISSTGYRDEVLEDLKVTVGQETDLGRIALEPIPLVAVTVVDDGTGAPVEGARVVLAQRDESDPTQGVLGRSLSMEIEVDEDDHAHGGSIHLGDTETRTERTDENGVALLTSFPGERCELRVLSDEHATYVSEPFVSPAGARDEHLVRLLEGGSVTVVMTTADGVPIAGGRVEHEAPGEDLYNWNFVGHGHDENVTDAEGRVTFAHLAEGTHRFRPEGSAGGAMNFSGQGGTRVRMQGRRMMLGGPGDVDEGWVEAVVSEGGSQEIALTAPVRVAVFGRVLEGGEPLEGAMVRVVEPGGDRDPMLAMFNSGGPESRTDGRGEYRLENVESGDYTLEVTHPTRSMPAKFDLVLGQEEKRFDVALNVAILEGRITSEEGQPLEGVRVWPELALDTGPRPRAMMISVVAMANSGGGGEVVSVSDAAGGSNRILTDADGTYQLRGVQPGVDLVVQAEGESVQPGKSEVITVGEGDVRRNVDVVLSAAGRIEVQAVTAEGKPARNVMVIAVYEGEADDVDRKSGFIQQGGSTSLEGLTPGPWRVTLREVGSLGGGGGGDPIPDQVIEVFVGETASATFTVP